MKRMFMLTILLMGGFNHLYGQLTNVINKHFSIGSYGRIGIARGDESLYPRSLNLNGMGSMGGRNEEADYFELATALHFTPVSKNADTTSITVQSRFAFYTTQGQIIGNVNSNSYGGITLAIPELYAEVKNIAGSPWGSG